MPTKLKKAARPTGKEKEVSVRKEAGAGWLGELASVVTWPPGILQIPRESAASSKGFPPLGSAGRASQSRKDVGPLAA